MTALLQLIRRSLRCSSLFTLLVLAACLQAVPALLLPAVSLAGMYGNVIQYTEEQGLPSSEVYSIAQAPDGSMWFGTRRGIVRYDGYFWSEFSTSEPSAPQSAHWLLFDSDGILYAIKQSGAILRLVGDKFHRIGVPTFQVRYTARVTGAQFLPGDGSARIAFAINDSLYIFEDGSYRRPRFIEERGYRVTSIAMSDSLLLFATDRGLRALAGLEEVAVPEPYLPLANHPLRAIHVERGSDGELQRLWFLDPRGVGFLESGKLHRFGVYPPMAFGVEEEPVSIVPDGTGGLLAASGMQIIHFRKDGTRIYLGKSAGLISEGCYQILRDRESNIWTATYRGVNKFHGFWVENHYAVTGLFADEVASIAAFPDGRMLLGHLGGFTLWDGERMKPFEAPKPDIQIPLTQARILDLDTAPDGTVWAAMKLYGLGQFDSQGRLLHLFRNDELEDFMTVNAEKDGTLLMGTSKGFFRYDPVSEGVEQLDDLAGAFPRVGYRPDPGADLYLCVAARGVYRWDGKQMHILPMPDDPAVRDVFNIVRTPWDEMVIGTRSGLYRLVEDGVEPIEIGERSFDRPVYLLYADSENLWIGTDIGLFKSDGERIKHYSVSSGLSGNELNRNAATMDTQGRIWFGTSRGLSIYDPAYDRDEMPQLEVSLIKMSSGGKPMPLHASFTLQSSHNDLLIRFQAITFVFEDQIQFRYYLHREGDASSQEVVTANREAQFLNLSPGKYIFEIQARHRNGHWGPSTIAETITVLPPYQDSWWFRTILLILLLGLFVLVNRYMLSRRTARILQSQVQQERAKLSQVVQNTRSLIVQADRNAIITYVNPDIKTILGYTPDEVVGKPYHQILFREDRQQVAESFREQVLQKRPTAILQCRLMTKNGALRWYSFTVSLSYGEGEGIAGMTAIAQDITERRDLEERLRHSQKMEAVGMLAGGVAHDFNNLLTAISGYSELAQLETEEGSPLEEHLNEIRKATDSAANLTRQLLAFSRKQTLQPRIVNLNHVILDRVTMLKRIVGETIRLEIDLAEDIWLVRVDPGQFEQVIVNLVVNARDAMPGGGWLTLQTRNRTIETDGESVSKGDWVQFDIRDTGTGIPEALQERIFEPFFTTKEKGRGTGLGLATVYGIVNQSGGQVILDSHEGVGTTFSVVLPRVPGLHPDLNGGTTSRRIASGNERILVVEDEESVRSFALEVLRRQGYQVDAAVDGVDAIERLDALENPVDLILTDVIMPRMNGPELAAKVSERWPGTKILFMSGYTASYIEARGLLSGGHPILIKPFRTEDLASRVRELLDFSEGNP